MGIELGDESKTYFAADEPVSGGISSGQPSDDIEEEKTEQKICPEQIYEEFKQKIDEWDRLLKEAVSLKNDEEMKVILNKAELLLNKSGEEIKSIVESISSDMSKEELTTTGALIIDKITEAYSSYYAVFEGSSVEKIMSIIEKFSDSFQSYFENRSKELDSIRQDGKEDGQLEKFIFSTGHNIKNGLGPLFQCSNSGDLENIIIGPKVQDPREFIKVRLSDFNSGQMDTVQASDSIKSLAIRLSGFGSLQDIPGDVKLTYDLLNKDTSFIGYLHDHIQEIVEMSKKDERWEFRKEFM